MKLALLVLLLSGCATPEWYDLTGPNYLKSVTVTKGQCRPGERACSEFFVGGHCTVTMGPDADTCSLLHELTHCAGWRHTGPDAGCGEQAYAQSKGSQK